MDSFNHLGHDDDDRSLSVYSDDECGVVDPEKGPRKSLGAKETKAVKCSRWFVVLVLVTATVLVSLAVYQKSRETEVSAFEETFSEYTEQIISTVHRNAQNKLEAVGSIAMQIQAHAITAGQTWPNVTVPFFEERIMAVQSLTDAYGVQLFPIVTNETREAWEEYSVQHRGWLNDSYAAQRRVYGEDQSKLEPGQTSEPGFDWFEHLWGQDNYNESNPDFSSGIASKIFGTTFNADKHPIIDPSDGPFFPQWQTAAASWYYQTSVNSNYGNFPDFFNQTQIIMETGTAAYGMAWSDGNVPGYISTMLYPIFDKFEGSTDDNGNGTQPQEEEPKVVAFTAIDLYWQAFVERILPPGADGIYVVIQNAAPCDQTFTFKIHGNMATFVDDGDQHEQTEEFDSMMESFVFGSQLMEPVSSLTYAGRPLYDDFCPYTFHIYPSQELKDKYVTDMPMWYTIIACSIFLFTSMVFLTYDCLVEKRQRLVLRSATQADNIVTSLFPQMVKEKLYEKERTSIALASKTKKMNKRRSTMKLGGNSNDVKEFMGAANPHDSLHDVSPIADLYPETTIMFADLVGFTAWSSKRQPNEVFQLLETLYGQFDAAAKRRGVFKVETIGDCYVAVTGIPRPQEQHALIMVKFAEECRLKMLQELHALADTLGPETLDLALRTGLHSGAVTAGVLRGEKARFQLFGDTMNTAARMESNSAPNRIHVSEATAQLLREGGKGHWVLKREEKIHAKGKGMLQTYWIDTRTDRSSATTESVSADAFSAELGLSSTEFHQTRSRSMRF